MAWICSMIVMLCLGGTCVGENFAAFNHESEKIEASTIEGTKEIAFAWQYDASDYTIAPKRGLLHGSGNAPGIFEIGARVQSSKVVRQQLSDGKLREFVYLPDKGIFAINKHLDYRRTGARFPGSDGSPHSTIRSSLPESGNVVGGNIRLLDGKYVTDEISGHYGRNWTPEIRKQFEKFMKEQNFGGDHTSF